MTPLDHETALHETRPTGRAADQRREAPSEVRPIRCVPDVLPLVAELLAAMERAAVRYCHWKSNEAIERSATGDNDLDLLIARSDAAVFGEILARLGFVLARPRHDRQLPGVVDHYGRDGVTGRILHVHAHYQLVLGDDMTKNFRLPVEEAYLRSASSDGLFMLPSPEFEYALFVLRMVVKHSTWDAQGGRKGRLTASERRELAWLRARIDRDELARIVDTHLPFLDRRSFEAVERAAAEETGHVRRALTAGRLLRALRAHARHHGAVDLGRRVARREGRRLLARLRVAQPKKRLDAGGVVIAVVGGDGAGKSSAVEVITDRLAHDFDVRRFHLGKPRPSPLTAVVRRALGKARRYGMLRATKAPPWGEFSRFPGTGYVVWHLLTARDRYLEYQRIRRFSGRGGIAICDRWPLPVLRTMDGPRTAGLPGSRWRPWVRGLVEREAGYYRHILPPDVLIVLRVEPERAVGRRPDQDEGFVRRRAAEVFEADWSSLDAVVVDADAPIEPVHRTVEGAIWTALAGRTDRSDLLTRQRGFGLNVNGSSNGQQRQVGTT
jgi:thymidylate kinase